MRPSSSLLAYLSKDWKNEIEKLNLLSDAHENKATFNTSIRHAFELLEWSLRSILGPYTFQKRHCKDVGSVDYGYGMLIEPGLTPFHIQCQGFILTAIGT